MVELIKKSLKHAAKRLEIGEQVCRELEETSLSRLDAKVCDLRFRKGLSMQKITAAERSRTIEETTAYWNQTFVVR